MGMLGNLQEQEDWLQELLQLQQLVSCQRSLFQGGLVPGAGTGRVRGAGTGLLRQAQYAQMPSTATTAMMRTSPSSLVNQRRPAAAAGSYFGHNRPQVRASDHARVFDADVPDSVHDRGV